MSWGGKAGFGSEERCVPKHTKAARQMPARRKTAYGDLPRVHMVLRGARAHPGHGFGQRAQRGGETGGRAGIAQHTGVEAAGAQGQRDGFGLAVAGIGVAAARTYDNGRAARARLQLGRIRQKIGVQVRALGAERDAFTFHNNCSFVNGMRRPGPETDGKEKAPAALRHGCARGEGGRGNAAGRRSFQRRRNKRLAAGLSGFDKGV